MDEVMASQFDITPPSKDELRALVADLSEDEKRVLLVTALKRLFAACSSMRNGREYTPAVCVDCRCSKRAQSLKAALAGRASRLPFQKTTSDPFATPATV